MSSKQIKATLGRGVSWLVSSLAGANRFYNLDETDVCSVNRYLSQLIARNLNTLVASGCIDIDEDDSSTIIPCVLGRIASYYYLSHLTVKHFDQTLSFDTSLPELIRIMAHAQEYAELPVRHNEDQVNSELAQRVPLPVDEHAMDSAHTKTHLLLQAHFSDTHMDSSDYLTDLRSVLDQAIRILQAMLDVVADRGWLLVSLRIVQLLQMVVQGRWVQQSSLLCLPHLCENHLHRFLKGGRNIDSLPRLIAAVGDRFERLSEFLTPDLDQTSISQIHQALVQYPLLRVSVSVRGWWKESDHEETRPLSFTSADGETQVVSLHADQEYQIQLDVRRVNRRPKQNGQRAIAPRFPKQKDEGWILVVGDLAEGELIALKRFPCVRAQSRVGVSFLTPAEPRTVDYQLYLMSDAYLGLDQQFSIRLEIIEESMEASLNSQFEWENRKQKGKDFV